MNKRKREEKRGREGDGKSMCGWRSAFSFGYFTQYITQAYKNLFRNDAWSVLSNFEQFSSAE